MSLPNSLRKPSATWRARLIVTLVVGGCLYLAATWSPLRRLEWLTENFRLKLREDWAMVPPTGNVVLLAIDEESLVSQGQWPFQRSVHGQLMEWLGRDRAVSPVVMSWDFVFTEETYDPALDQMFAAPLSTAGYPILMGAFSDPAATGIFSQGRAAPRLGLTRPLALPPEVVNALPDRHGMQIPILPLLDTTRFVMLDAEPDDDGIIRKIPMIIRVGDRVFPGLVLGTLLVHWQVEPDQIEVTLGDTIVLHTASGDKRIPIDGEGYYSINYRYEMREKGSAEGIPVASYQGVLDTLAPWAAFGDAIPQLDIAGKIVVVGQTATGLTDIGPSPLRKQSGRVLVQLNALENILRGDYLRRVPVGPGLALVLMLGLGVAWVLDRWRTGYAFALAVILVLAFGVTLALMIFGNYTVPLAVPLVGFVLQQTGVTILKIREEQAQRDRIRRMFGSYVSPELVRRMVEARAEPQLGGHEDEITAFFSDIQGFSAFSEVLSPVDLVQLLNEYLGGMTDILQANGGALDKYIGDAIVAMFGGLVPVKDHARCACEAAAQMQVKQARLREHWKAQGDRWPALVHTMRTRIGLNSGQVVVGNMGSQHRFNYTMMGDTVNLAARCESGAKTFGVYTVATGATVLAAKASGCACVFRELDRIVVKGRKEPVVIFEIVAPSVDELPDAAQRCLELFDKGRGHYLKQEWDEAMTCFAESAPGEPLRPARDGGVDSNPSLIMLARCEALKRQPPGEDWDGVYRMTTK
jgi:adenylate cyclase